MENQNTNVVEFTPRPYQIELYNAAKRQNTIVCLGTGTGKTFIAILLMKDPEFASQLRGDYLFDAKRTVFLVPTRPLVKQQAKEIGIHFHIKVGEYTGDKNVDAWDKSKWDKQLIKNQVIVMTPQIFLDMLAHGFIKFDKINLLVIDEVHWAARKKGKKESGHPYKQIMKIYNSLPEHERPRVLGLSASLINSSIKTKLFDDLIHDLEDTYSAKCITSDIAQMCGTNPDELICTYFSQSSSSDLIVTAAAEALNKFIVKLKEKKSDDDKVSASSTKFQKCLTNVRNMLKDCGPQDGCPTTMSWMGIWCANVAIDFYIEEMTQYKELYKNLNPNHAELYEIIINFLSMIKCLFDPRRCPQMSDPKCALKTASPKMFRLLELLKKYKPIGAQESQLCGIVFVNRRAVAKVLAEWLTKLKEIEPTEFGFLNVGWVVGHSSKPGYESLITSFSDRKQQETIQKFRDNQLNLLVATSVLEEGLDVRKCNVVIRYDKPKTFREYLQSKGRARAEGASYYMMTRHEGENDLKLELKNYQELEEKIKNLNSKQLPSDGANAFNFDDSSEEEEVYKTGDARITTRSAIALLYRYCQRLPSDSFTKLVPYFELEEKGNKFRCSVRLPVNCPLKEIIYGKCCDKKFAARRSAALEACKQLHKIEELDSNFLPIKKEQFIEKYVEILGLNHYNKDFDKSTGPRPGTQSRNEIYQKKLAQVFTKSDVKGNTYYLHGIKLDYELINSLNSDPITFGVVTYKPIKSSCSFPVFVKSGRVKVQFVPLNPIQINLQQKDLIEKFHKFTFSEVLQLENSEIGFSPIGSEFQILTVPIKKGGEINWDFLKLINTQKPIEVKQIGISGRLGFSFNKELYKDCVFYPWYREEQNPVFYNCLEITKMTPKSAFNDDQYETFEHFYRQKYRIEICNKSQLLIKGRTVQNFAQIKSFTTKQKKRHVVKEEFFVPELIKIHPFPQSLWRGALCLPAILYRLNSLFIAEELRKTIHLETNPSIGFLEPINNYLTLDSEMPVEDMDTFETDTKRLHSSDEYDDGCDGHPFDFESGADDFTEFLNQPPKKKQKNQYSIIKIESDPRRDQSLLDKTNLMNSNITSNSIDSTMNLIKFTDVLIRQYNLLLSESRKKSNQSHLNEIDFDQIDFATMKGIENNCPPAYGESFPFIFSGDIELSIREKYDAKIGDPIRGPTADLILNALTLLNANDGFNFERLETIGDSFLKFVTTAYLYYSCPKLDEGRLSYLRSIQICNCNLYHIGLDKNIGELLVATKFYPKQNWLPPYYETSDENEAILITDGKLARSHHLVSDKSIADSIEALIGAYLLSGGNKCALIFMQWLGLKVSPDKLDFCNKKNRNDSDIWRWLPLPKSPIVEHLTPEQVEKGLAQDYDGGRLDYFEEIIGYKFKNKAYLVQALTHSSYYHNQITDCYQRLEFLGDALLDYLITRHIFKDSHKFSPGELTDLRSALVNNAFFASIAVKFSFHKYLKVLSPDLFRAIEHFVKKFECNKVEAVKNCFTSLHEEEVDDLEEIEVPKALGDIFESVAGAIFLDNGLSLDGVWRIYYKMLKPEIDYFSKNIPKMPVRELREKFPSAAFSNTEPVAGRKIRIVAKVDGKEFAGIGINKKFAKTAASKCALRALKPTKNNQI